MIDAIHFENFKALKDARLPLGPFSLIVGPNGSGKSTAMQALACAVNRSTKHYDFRQIATQGLTVGVNSRIKVSIYWSWRNEGTTLQFVVDHNGNANWGLGPLFRQSSDDNKFTDVLWSKLEGFRVFSFDPASIARQVQTQPSPELGSDGSDLAGVLDALRDSSPERFEALNQELARWLPEFDRILFETPNPGMKAFLLRAKVGGYTYPAANLSQGVLLALAFLTLAYLPSPPPIVCFEEPERGIHPRLLNEIREGMYRLAYPQEFGETRDAVQVIATTHSPYFLDLYKEHPEEIVIAHKDAGGVHFERLSDKPHISELLEGAPLGDIWYSGVLGGVPSTP